MIYKVNIEETINGEFEVVANSKKEAFAIARNKYYNGEFVNEPGSLSCVKVAVSCNNDFGEWVEF